MTPWTRRLTMAGLAALFSLAAVAQEPPHPPAPPAAALPPETPNGSMKVRAGRPAFELGDAYRFEAAVFEVTGDIEQLMKLDGDSIAKSSRTPGDFAKLLAAVGDSSLRLRVDQCARGGLTVNTGVTGSEEATVAPAGANSTFARRRDSSCELKFEISPMGRDGWIDGLIDIDCYSTREAGSGGAPAPLFVSKQRIRHPVAARNGQPVVFVTVNGSGGPNGQPVAVLTWVRLSSID